MPTTRDRYLGVDQRAIREWIAGSWEPSPSPDKTRSSVKRTMWVRAAEGVSRATTDDRSIQPPNNHLPPKRSASQPPGICKQIPQFHIVWRLTILKPYFHYDCALRCVAREIETLSASLYLSPRNATRSRNGNKPLLLLVRSKQVKTDLFPVKVFSVDSCTSNHTIWKRSWATSDHGSQKFNMAAKMHKIVFFRAKFGHFGTFFKWLWCTMPETNE